MMRVKICGIGTVADCRAAVAAGADAVGVLVGRIHQSADFINCETAAAICEAAGPFVVPVLVTHLTDVDELLRLSAMVPAWVVQAHGDLSAGELARLRHALRPKKLIGKVSIEGPAAIDRARSIAPAVDGLLLDSIDRAADRVGGTGLVHDWSLSARIVASVDVPVVLAGGLNPDNVAQAIAVVRPWGVDVNTGVKSVTGGKDPALLAAFVSRARGG